MSACHQRAQGGGARRPVSLVKVSAPDGSPAWRGTVVSQRHRDRPCVRMAGSERSAGALSWASDAAIAGLNQPRVRIMAHCRRPVPAGASGCRRSISAPPLDGALSSASDTWRQTLAVGGGRPGDVKRGRAGRTPCSAFVRGRRPSQGCWPTACRASRPRLRGRRASQCCWRVACRAVERAAGTRARACLLASLMANRTTELGRLVRGLRTGRAGRLTGRVRAARMALPGDAGPRG
jgi:hypothetical protein